MRAVSYTHLDVYKRQHLGAAGPAGGQPAGLQAEPDQILGSPVYDDPVSYTHLVDVGIHVNEEGKLCGDVLFDEAEPIVEAVTPVPGGVGTVTTSVLVGHVVDAASAQ